ncbi:putative transporter [Xylona heveae TC161]|uniref:Putative transporter n=1 Tax=Xylona heveae (strain CBS 132557 / TC161) TaxID=1328760 RepID=A0A165JXP1_XYLHT|nr:putative transporter [Xylona heveae TC161]KZF26756.1 putative transporter [Xylona heveae TC161]
MDQPERRPLIQKPGGEEVEDRENGSRRGLHGASPLSIAVALFGVFLAGGDESLVISMYGEVASEFQNLTDGPWLMTGYTLGYCVALPLYGRLSDIYGRKRPLLAAYCLYCIGCLTSGTAVGLWQAIAGRVVNGIGGAGMVALISVIITDIATLEQVAVLRSYVNVAAVAGRSAGPPLGGFLADTIGWRWAFLAQAPIALLCLVLAKYTLPSGPAQSHNEHSCRSSKRAKWKDVDFLGVITFVISMVSFLLFLDLGGQKLPWSHPVVIALIAACSVCSLAFVLIEKFWAVKPLIPLWLIRENGVGISCLVQILVFWGRLATLSHLATFYIRTMDATNTVAAAFIVPSSVGNAVGALLSGAVISRTFRYKTLSAITIIVACISYTLVVLRWRHGANIFESFYIFPVGVTFGMVLSAQFVGLSASAPTAQKAIAISMYYLSQQVGTVIGIGSAATLLRADFRSRLFERLVGFPERDQLIQGILDDARFAATLPAKLKSVVRTEYLQSFQLVPIMSLVTTALALPLILWLREHPLR